LKVLELLESALGGTLVGVEAALETLEAVFEVLEGGAEGVLAAADVTGVVQVVVQGVIHIEPLLPEVGLDGAETADLPFVVNQGVDEVSLPRGDRVELGIVFGGELSEGVGVFASDDVGLGMKAGFQGVHAGGGFSGLGAGTGRMLRIATIREELFFSCHK
jgi:hypothetical protein